MTTKVLRHILLVVCFVGTSLVLSGCGLVAREPELSPQEVVSAFYRWYIGYPGNPLVDREYRESPYLAEPFVGEVDEIAKEGFRVDPFLLAQDIPERFAVDGVEVSEDEASVVLSLYWGGNPTPTERRIHLRLIDGAWMITDVSLTE